MHWNIWSLVLLIFYMNGLIVRKVCVRAIVDRLAQDHGDEWILRFLTVFFPSNYGFLRWEGGGGGWMDHLPLILFTCDYFHPHPHRTMTTESGTSLTRPWRRLWLWWVLAWRYTSAALWVAGWPACVTPMRPPPRQLELPFQLRSVRNKRFTGWCWRIYWVYVYLVVSLK